MRITLTIDEDVLRAVELRADCTGRAVNEVVDESLRREFALEALWANVEPLPEGEAMTLALAAQRHGRRSRG